jgi:hypothetical protein
MPIEEGRAFMASLRQRIQNPSQRNLNMSWELNPADQIEHQLREDRHRTWGFVIYRTTYDNDADWTEFIKRLKFHMHDTFEWVGGQDILDKFSLTIFDDREKFDGASTQAVRQHFQQWSVAAYRDEQRQEADSSDRTRGTVIGRSPRYRYAIAIDAESLHSVVHEAPAPPELDASTKGWVKLIDKSWYLGRSLGRDPEDYPAPEGNTESDVGWMRVTYWAVMSECYVRSESINFWSNSYRRPPQVMHL